MKHLPKFLFLIIVLAPLAALADLNSEVSAVLSDKMLRRASVGIDVVQLGKSPAAQRAIYSRNRTTTFIPASNLKLVTTAAALQQLGGDFKFRTVLLLHRGNLVLIGDGDPSFGDGEYLKTVGWSITTVFENWAQQIKKYPIAAVQDVIVDDSVFDQEFVHPRWPEDQLHKRYVAEVAGLNLNANCVDFQIQPGAIDRIVSYTAQPKTAYLSVDNSCVRGNKNAIWLSRAAQSNEIILAGEAQGGAAVEASVTIHDPALFTGTVLAETLRKGGINLNGRVRRDRSFRGAFAARGENSADWTVLGIHETPLSTVLTRANKDSMNLYAESLCKRMGNRVTRSSGTWASGTGAIASFLTAIGVPQGQFQLDDGSGLSKNNRISPSAIVAVLAHNFHGANREAYMASLSVAGVDGTLDNRFKGSDLRGRVIGKSGFVNGVSALSGYLKARDGHWYAFSILMNGIPHQSNSSIKVLQERIVAAIDANTAGVAAGR